MKVPSAADRPATALLLVDVIVSFFEPGRANHYPGVETVLAPMRCLLDAARQSQSLVVHAAERHRAGFEDWEWRKLPRHHEGDDAAFVPGFEPAGPREVLIAKRRFSAFFATDLALFLHEQGVRRLVIAGVKTNVCIRASAQDAFAHGFEPVVPRQATNSNRSHLAAAALEDIERYMGRVVELDEAVAMLS